jgi:hypothetical protein
MLRAAGIPARLINGFKGGDWNEFGQVMTVRQKHAHSWVEALIDDYDYPIWITLDPTPAQQREAVVASVGGISNRFLPLSDYIRYLWLFYVAGYNSERQERLLYQPIRALIQDARDGFRMMGRGLRAALARLLHFPSVSSFFSIRGFIVSFLALFLLTGVIRAILWLDRRINRLLRRPGPEDPELASGMVAYRRLVALLAAHGLQRFPPETPREFARRASESFSTHGPSAQAAADVPSLIVEAFYRIRFGHAKPAPELQALLEQRLDALEAALAPEKT